MNDLATRRIGKYWALIHRPPVRCRPASGSPIGPADVSLLLGLRLVGRTNKKGARLPERLLV